MTAKTKRLPGVARIGIGGPVGSGKTALIERLIPVLKARNIEVGVVANDIVTQGGRRTDQALGPDRSGPRARGRDRGLPAYGDPRGPDLEHPSRSKTSSTRFPELDVVLVESGGDNLASTFSLELVDYWLFVIDIAGGDDIPRKRGLGILRSDLLVINKTDLAPFVGANID